MQGIDPAHVRVAAAQLGADDKVSVPTPATGEQLSPLQVLLRQHGQLGPKLVPATSGSSPQHDWEPGPFRKYDQPLMVRGQGFESLAVLNPTVIRDGDTWHMLYRAWDGASHRKALIGHATSRDGFNWKRDADPIRLLSTEESYDRQGVEDPRITKIGDTYILTYVGINPDYNTSHICVATSKDLIHWDKHGPVLPIQDTSRWDGGYRKAAVIVPQKINGKYVMYYLGEAEPWKTAIGVAYSDDLIHWEPDPDPILLPRGSEFFDSRGVEPGPTPIVTDKGILLVYNGWDKDKVHKTAAVLFDKNDPSKVISRSDNPLLEPTLDWEKNGLVPNVTFTEGLVEHDGKYYMYYGAADSVIGLAVADKPLEAVDGIDATRTAAPQAVRHPGNPLIVGDADNKPGVIGYVTAFNPSVALDTEGPTHLVFRGIDPGYTKKPDAYGYDNYHSSIWHTHSRTGVDFAPPKLLIERSKEHGDPYGVEDPRVTSLNGTYYIFFTAMTGPAFTGRTDRIGLATTKDFDRVERHGIVGPDIPTKAATIFPELVNGDVVMLYKNEAAETINIARFSSEDALTSMTPDSSYWQEHVRNIDQHLVLGPRGGPGGWESRGVETGAPPIKTDKGWLMIYSGA